MTTTNIQSLLNQAMEQLESIGKDTSTNSSSQKDTFINSIHTVAKNAEGITSNNGEEKTKSANILNDILGLISSAKNQISKANQETKRNADDINKNQNAAENKSNQIEKSIEEITKNITTNTESIEQALKEIEKLGNNGDIAKVQEEITKQLKVIETEKENLKSSDPKTREKALETIGVAAEIINNLVSNINSMESEIDQQNEIVDSSVKNITELIETSATQITNGIAEIQKHIQNSTVIGAETQKIMTQGAINKVEGEALITAGNTINSNIASAALSGGKGAQMVAAGNQYVAAGDNRVTGGTNNVKSLTSSIGQIGSMISEIKGYAGGIGQITAGVASLAVQYTQTVQPYIEATGSWDVEALQEANTELQSQVENADQILKNEEEKKALFDTSKFYQAFGV